MTLNAQIELLENVKGWSKFSRDLSRNLGQFDHAMVQLEVAGFAKRDNWEVELEPGTHGKRSTDIVLNRNDEVMYVEIRRFHLDDTTARYMRRGQSLSNVIFDVQNEFDVWIIGDRLGDVAKLNLSELDGRLRAAAIYARDNHRDVLVSLESQGELTVSPEQPEDGVLHSYEVQHADELGRIGARVQEKAEQGRGVEPLWLRFNESSHFFGVVANGDPLQVDEQLTQRIGDELRNFPHVAGVMLSTIPLISSNETTTETEILNNLGRSLVSPQYNHFTRDSLLVRGPHAHFDQQSGYWMNWYRNESTWLAWAHEQLGLPDLELIFG
jgi:hypothetical protein